MTLRLRSIETLDDDRYELTFDAEDGSTETVVCQVFDHKGITGVQPEPDVFMTGQADAREVTRAVLAYRQAHPPPAS
jgi:hypothetical protein